MVFFEFFLSKFLTFIIYVDSFHLFIGLFPLLFFILLLLCLLCFSQHKNDFFLFPYKKLIVFYVSIDIKNYVRFKLYYKSKIKN